MTTNRIRLPLAALSLGLIALLGACSNATGPDAGASRRSGFITSSSAQQSVAPSPSGTKAGSTSGTVAKPDSSSNQPQSGYNVTAF